MCIIPKTVLIANVKIWTVYCFVYRVNFQALIGWGAKTKACKPIINQVEKIQFDYAAGVSAYSDSVSAYSDRHCFSSYIYIFFFLCFQKTFRNFILQIYDKERKWDSDIVSAAVTATVQHHMFIHNCFLFANGAFRHHYTSWKKNY